MGEVLSETVLQEIEQAFLGACLVSDKAFQDAAGLRPAHFFIKQHADIFEAIGSFHADGRPVSVPLVAARLEGCEGFEGGPSEYIRGLAESVISVVSAPDYAREIYAAHCRRALAHEVAQNDGSPEGLNRIAHFVEELTKSTAIKKRRLRPYAWPELQNLPAPRPLIKGVLDCGALSVVYGESNCGKTFFALDMSLHVALSGRQWRERRVQGGRVLYIAAEAGLSIVRRLSAFSIHHGLQDAPDFHLIPVGVDFCKTQDDARAIVREAKALGGVDMIVVDTLSRAMAGGNENGPDDMGAFIKNVDHIRENTGAHVLVVHHAGKDQARGARGHSSLRAAVDTEIEITKSEDGIVTAEIQKQRDNGTGERFSFALEVVDVGRDDDGDKIMSCVLVPSDAPAKQKPAVRGQKRRALEILHEAMIDHAENVVPKNGMPLTKVIRIEQFRISLKNANICNSDKPDNLRRGISQVIDGLNNSGLTATYGDYIWPIG